MKTASKILLAAFALVVIVLFFLMLALRNELGREVIHGSGQRRTVNYEMPAFDAVEVHGQLRVSLVQTGNYRVQLTADDNILELITSEVDRGRLRVSLDDRVAREVTIEVQLELDVLKSLTGTGGVTLHGPETLRGGRLVHQLGTGARSTLNLEYDEVELGAQMGSVVSLAGRAGTLSADIRNGAILEAGQFEVASAEIACRNGAVASLKVSRKLTARAGQGSVINYSGNPDQTSFTTSRGGQIVRNPGRGGE